MQIVGGAAIGLNGSGAWPQRVLIRAELDHVIKARDMRRTPLIQVDLHNARLRCDLCHLALFLTLLPPFYRGQCGDATASLPRPYSAQFCAKHPAQRKRPHGLHRAALQHSTGEET